MHHRLYTIAGFARYPSLDVPDRRFLSSGYYQLGIVAARADLRALKAACADLFARAYGHPGSDLSFPIRAEPAGREFVQARTRERPNILIPRERRAIGILRGDTVRVSGTLHPYQMDSRCGVRFLLEAVEFLAADTARAA
ncbi:hypothetical protein MOX02_17360 [Methylobacterium oxalidis]|uniref:Uncharacterized protein n=2 Tax=Methylobacterium oxalidis TaxID=944322 RepID=A0A512J145_9HYPH|nr:hypothetical protein [Methylobacterium oxalidis]GEP03698.1 hypothetical protein MOX02_17360 [Methylobacterium oxalidis]GJE33696.1 hypothetical protein LDDCCGHA_3899 [Methylobacterium oxalidis]GLS62282.1 hypothetical protein GCM10007888_06630 [Methylobacterium oxalidis]